MSENMYGIDYSNDLLGLGGNVVKAPDIDAMNAVTPPPFKPIEYNQYARTPGVSNDNKGFNYSGLGTLFKGVSAGADAFNAYTGWKSYGLAKDQFAFEKAAANRNIATQGKLINDDIMNSAEVGMSLAGNTLNSTQRAAATNKAKDKYVDTSAIG